MRNSLAIAALLCSFGTNRALSQPADIQELKIKLQQLEQMVSDLKSQVAVAEQSQRPPGSPPLATSTNVVGNQPPQVPILRLSTTYIGRETQQRQTAGNNDASAPRVDNESLDSELRGFFRVPATETLIKLGGFVKTDFFYDLNYTGSYYGAYVPSSFPSTTQPKSRDSTISMRPSRFNVEFRQPAFHDNDSIVKGYLEWDFLGNYERTSLRMRQFYGQYKN